MQSTITKALDEDLKANGALDAGWWDIVTVDDLNDAEALTPAYDYHAQRWTTVDHAHTNGNDVSFCGALLASCCPRYHAAIAAAL